MFFFDKNFYLHYKKKIFNCELKTYASQLKNKNNKNLFMTIH